MTHVGTQLLEIEDSLSRMVRQIEATGQSYAKAYKQINVVDAKLRQACPMEKMAIAEHMHLQTMRLHQLSSLFPAMSNLVMQLRKEILASLANVSTPPGHSLEKADIQELLASLKTVDTLVEAMLGVVGNELSQTSKTLNAVIAA